jgi:Protein of unknown function (DUF3143)
MMTKLAPTTPLYNHPLPDIEQWLRDMGCEQSRDELSIWYVEKPTWKAEIELDIDQINVRYINAASGNQDIKRSFKYSLSREDIQEAVFSGP